MKTPELLCPAGAFANLKAAVASGADAVYLGMPDFSARSYATNFNKDFLKKAVQVCKSNDVKVYLAMNTLIKNSELRHFFQQIDSAYLAGIDAVILQDPSFIKLIKGFYPDLKVHISTQAGVMNRPNANLFKEADRINLARELSKENLLSIRKTFPKELEMFIHGALCVCISGSCLFSSFLGGRSGNRGKCAQPCRKLYNEEFYLSTKELCLLDQIHEIKKTGIDSLKIEGRMRTPYYVAVTTSFYRSALDNNNFRLTPEIIKKIKSAYTREFTHGKYLGEDVFNRQKAEGAASTIRKEYEVPIKNISINREIAPIKIPEIKEKTSKKQLLVRVYNKKDALAIDGKADIIYLDLFNPDFLETKKQLKTKLFAVTPRIMFDSDIKSIKEKIREINPEGILAGNLGVLDFGLKIPIHLDYNCNCFNDLNLYYLQSLGTFPIISPELSIGELSAFKNKDFAVLVHGKIRLMTLAHDLDKESIADKKGKFLIKKIMNGSEILNEKELGLFNKARNLIRSEISSFYIDTENNVPEVVDIYKQILDGKTPEVSKIKNDYVLGWIREGVF
jgi:collagenase-like PrtC family protease